MINLEKMLDPSATSQEMYYKLQKFAALTILRSQAIPLGMGTKAVLSIMVQEGDHTSASLGCSAKDSLHFRELLHRGSDLMEEKKPLEFLFFPVIGGFGCQPDVTERCLGPLREPLCVCV